MLTALVILSFGLAALPALLFLQNLRLYRTPRRSNVVGSVSVLIPARNEERTIGKCVRSVLESEGVELEVIVLDDHSEDRTADIVNEIAQQDERVKLIAGPPLPLGWCGKQFACAELARHARLPLLCFIDADVRLKRDGLARMVAGLRESRAALLSGFPRQITVTPMEQLLLPLMHFLLLGFLPLSRMRQSLDPSLGAGCGQLFLADRLSYENAGGHATIRDSLHDGLSLPKAFRRAGFRTDLCDATAIASCRMYCGAREVVAGLLKNATEGLAHPKRILPFSLLLIVGQIVPVPLLGYVWARNEPVWLRLVAAAAVVFSNLPRLLAAKRFRQPVFAALLHPVAVAALLALQWIALVRIALHVPATWKGRSYSTP